MDGLQFDPQQLLQELNGFAERLGRGLETLNRLSAEPLEHAPRTLVYRYAGLSLYRYDTEQSHATSVPLLICYALVNRPDMLDLQPDRSFIRNLLAAGMTVYLIDWGEVTADEKTLSLRDYICDRMRRCVDVVRRRHRQTAIDLLGVCQGGVFSLIFTALYPQRIRRLVTMVTPVNFHTPDNTLGQLGRHINAELLTQQLGNIPGAWLNSVFLFLNPYRLASWKYLQLLQTPDDEQMLREFVRMERWIFDSPDQAGLAFSEFARQLVQDNALYNGALRIGRRRVRLTHITQPLLNIYANADHIVPPSSAQALASLTASVRYGELEVSGGHIGVYVSRRAQAQVAPAVIEWLQRE